MDRENTYPIIDFLKDEIRYFREKSENLTYEEYSSNRDVKKILNATVNDIVLAVVDLAGEALKKKRRRVPDTYKDIILASREIVGDVALKAAPLAKMRNETIHEYMNVNWKNIQYLRSSGITIVDEFINEVESFLTKQKKR